MYALILILHVLGATIWAGGYLVLTLRILPRAVRGGHPEVLLEFESAFEVLGLTALFVQVLTGLWLAYRILPDPAQWFSFDSVPSTYISVKLVLLIATLALAVDARLRLAPYLGVQNLPSFAYHIVAVTIIAVVFVVMGVGIRLGGLF